MNIAFKMMLGLAFGFNVITGNIKMIVLCLLLISLYLLLKKPSKKWKEKIKQKLRARTEKPWLAEYPVEVHPSYVRLPDVSRSTEQSVRENFRSQAIRMPLFKNQIKVAKAYQRQSIYANTAFLPKSGTSLIV